MSFAVRSAATSCASETGYPLSLFWIAACVIALTLGGSMLYPGVVVQADEGSYLLNAAAIAGRLRHTALIYEYSSGYSLLLAPAFILFSDLDSVYRCALAINALIMAATPFAIFRLTRLVYPTFDVRWHVLAAAATTFYADTLSLGQFVLADNLLVPLYSWALALAATLLLSPVRGSRAPTAVLGGACVGFLMLVHARGGPMAAAVLVPTSLACIWRRDLRGAVLLLWAAAAVVAALHIPLEHLAGKSDAHKPFSWTLSAVLSRIDPRTAWFDIPRNLLGATAYAAVASVTVAVLGFRAAVAAAYRSWTSKSRVDARSAVLLACAAGAAGCLLTTAVFFTPPARLDHILYGRYALPAIVPLVAVGLLQCVPTTRGRSSEFAWAIGLTLSLLAATFAAIRYAPTPTPTAFNVVNSPGAYLAYDVSGKHLSLPVTAAFFAVQAAVLYGFLFLRAHIGFIVFVASNVLTAAYFAVKWTTEARIYYSTARYVVSDAKRFESLTGSPLCVDIDKSLSDWHRIDFATRLYSQIYASSRAADGRCVRGFITALNSPTTTVDGMQLVSAESHMAMNGKPVGLFVESGHALDVYAQSVALPIPDAFFPLPEAERQARIDIDPIAPQLRLGANLSVRIRVTNGSTVSAWSSSGLVGNPVLVGARLRAANGAHVSPEPRAALQGTLAPGETETITLDLGPLRTQGVWTVDIGVLQEGVAWFSGVRTFSVVVEP